MINERPSFGAARVNILATADNHGNIMRMPRVLKTIENNAKETLVIQPQDDFIKVVDDFCAKFGLNDDKKIRLIRTIKDKMRKNEC